MHICSRVEVKAPRGTSPHKPTPFLMVPLQLAQCLFHCRSNWDWSKDMTRPGADGPWRGLRGCSPGPGWDQALRGTRCLNLFEPEEAEASLGQSVRSSSVPRAGMTPPAPPPCPPPRPEPTVSFPSPGPPETHHGGRGGAEASRLSSHLGTELPENGRSRGCCLGLSVAQERENLRERENVGPSRWSCPQPAGTSGSQARVIRELPQTLIRV